jgi:hypothetical protein
MKRRFHCKKVERVKGKVIVILSQAKNLRSVMSMPPT